MAAAMPGEVPCRDSPGGTGRPVPAPPPFPRLSAHGSSWSPSLFPRFLLEHIWLQYFHWLPLFSALGLLFLASQLFCAGTSWACFSMIHKYSQVTWSNFRLRICWPWNVPITSLYSPCIPEPSTCLSAWPPHLESSICSLRALPLASWDWSTFPVLRPWPDIPSALSASLLALLDLSAFGPDT